MLRAGDQLDLGPRLGVRGRVVRAPADPSTEPLDVEFVFEGKRRGPPRHLHPRQSDEFTVIEGDLRVFDGRRWRDLTAQDRLTIPAGTVHTLRNPGREPVRFVNRHLPAHSFGDTLEQLHLLARARKLDSLIHPRAALHLALLFSSYPADIRPPSRVQAAALTAGASLATRLGCRLPPRGPSPTTQ